MLELIIAGLGELTKMAADSEGFGEAAETQQDAEACQGLDEDRAKELNDKYGQ